MSEFQSIERGFMIVKNGMAWGTSYSDGRETCYGWVSPTSAHLYSVGSIRSKSQASNNGAHDIKELKSGEMVLVERVTTVKIV